MSEVYLIISIFVATLLVLGIVVILRVRKRNEQVKSEKPGYNADFKNDWYDGVSKQINGLKTALIAKDYKKFRLNLLLCLAQRVAGFSSECGQCMLFQQDITALVRDMGNLIQVDDRKERKAYFKSINKILGHLQKSHKLVTEGYYVGICMALGSGIGVALGSVMDSIGSGVPIGVGIGVAIGAALDAKAKKDGRVICTRETTGSGSVPGAGRLLR